MTEGQDASRGLTLELPPVKFLLVDDFEDGLLALEALLARPDLEILSAKSAAEALELLAIHDVALAILDVEMPEVDGFQLAKQMRGAERTRGIPIIFATAGSHDPTRVSRAYAAGAVDVLFKPLDPAVLTQKANIFFDLYRRQQELAETLRLNETFVAAISHDLRNPLNTILMGSEIVLSGTLDERSRRASERIRSSGRRMVTLIDQLFDLARIRLGGGLLLDRQSIDLAKLVRTVVAENQIANPDRVVVMQEEGNTEGEWDPARVAQIASNLVGNALKHGSPHGVVVVKTVGHGSLVALSVHNDGAIEAPVKANLFEPFRRGKSRQKDGLGLGLFIVKQLTLAHEGSLDLVSNAEQGTTFRIALPRRVEEFSHGRQ
jgi:two-component system sensor histidine kinase/response regulator